MSILSALERPSRAGRGGGATLRALQVLQAEERAQRLVELVTLEDLDRKAHGKRTINKREAWTFKRDEEPWTLLVDNAWRNFRKSVGNPRDLPPSVFNGDPMKQSTKIVDRTTYLIIAGNRVDEEPILIWVLQKMLDLDLVRAEYKEQISSIVRGFREVCFHGRNEPRSLAIARWERLTSVVIADDSQIVNFHEVEAAVLNINQRLAQHGADIAHTNDRIETLEQKFEHFQAHPKPSVIHKYYLFPPNAFDLLARGVSWLVALPGNVLKSCQKWVEAIVQTPEFKQLSWVLFVVTCCSAILLLCYTIVAQLCLAVMKAVTPLRVGVSVGLAVVSYRLWKLARH